jgi:preprotein translocase subunit SecY
MLFLLAIVIAAIVAITQAVRKIPVQYAKRVVGRKVYGGQSSYLPLKVNYSGVMPVIFGSALLMFPSQLFTWAGASTPMLSFLQDIGTMLGHGQPFFYVAYGLLILFFSYFWVSVMFKPIQIADDLKKYGGYIPGVRPGEHTAKFLDFVMTRLTLFGAIFLTVIAILPDFLLYQFNVPQRIGTFFGGTGMLITVGVVLDTMRQIETFLLQRHYDGFLRKGRIRGRSDALAAAPTATATVSLQNARPLYGALLVIFAIGILAWALQLQ